MTRHSFFTKRNARIVLWTLVVIQLVLIFSLSSQTASESGGLSAHAARVVARIVTPGFDTLSVREQNHHIRQHQHLVRKTAHVCEYAMLALFLTLALHRKPMWKGAAIAVSASTLYAALDEIHQLGVPGRGASFYDVIIDVCGACLGTLLAMICLRIFRKYERKRKIEQDEKTTDCVG